MSRECLASIPKPRKRQSINGLSEPEIRGAPLSHILDNTATPIPTTSNRSPVTAYSGEDRHVDTPRDVSGAKPQAGQSGSRSFVALFAHGLGLDETSQACLDSLAGVDYAFLQESFTTFERMASRSPFVELPSTDLIKMVAKRPVTSLAICTVTTSVNMELRLRLVRTFRHTVSAKCIIDDDKSIDLMAGLFIHTIWHHRYMHKQQIYQYLHLLTGLAAQQGLHQQFGLDTYSSQQPDREVQLLFLGTYYLCSIVTGLASDKPSPFRWSDHLSSVAFRFSFRGPFASNNDTVSLTELGHYIGDADNTIRESSESYDTPAHNRTWSLWHNSEAELRRLKGLVHKSSIVSHPDVQATKIAVSTIILQNSQHVQTRLLTDIAISIKDYFDTVLAEPPAWLLHSSIIDWTNLLSVLATLILILHPRFEAWEAVPGAVRSLLEPEILLDALVTRVSTPPPHERHEELIHWFSNLAARIKAKWQRDRRPRAGSGEVSETEARFRPVNAGNFYGERSGTGEAQGQRGNYGGASDIDVGRVCRLDLLEDAFWDRLLQS